jgi:hypothetical protein
MKLSLLYVIIALLAIFDCHAQYASNQNKVWAFGYKAGVDFNSGTPVPIITGFDNTTRTEGVASVCDTAGHLLFYTNGKQVYNRNHMLMPTGASIVPYLTFSATQAAQIVPVIGSPGRYYVFSLENVNFDTPYSHLAYSIVDMALDGGYGDVEPSTMGTIFQDSLSEKMTAITGNDKNIWLMVHKQDTAIFLAYNITAAGIDTFPVVSAVGRFSGDSGAYAVGVLKASPNRRRIVSQTAGFIFGNKLGCELFDFNPGTGVVSNCIVLDSLNSQYGAEFSPDNSQLYVREANGDTVRVNQYNIALSSAGAIRSSKTLLQKVSFRMSSSMQLGPDGKIYLAGADDSLVNNGYSRFLDCINSPNLPGTSCGYTTNVVTFPYRTGIHAGLPNGYVSEDTVVTLFVDETTDLSSFSVFPNPTTNELTVSAPVSIHHIGITNVSGREVYRGEYHSSTAIINTGALVPGVYFLSVNNTAVRSFLKQ